MAQHDGTGRPRRPGEGDRCPVCGATAGVAAQGDGYACLVCGSPRVLVDGIVQRGGSEKPFLERAKSLKIARDALVLGAGVALVLGVLTLMFAAVTSLFLGPRGFLIIAAALVPFGAALTAWRASKRRLTAFDAVMTDAELAVAKELITVGAARTGTELETLMKLPTGRADDLFGRAEVERMLAEPDPPPQERLRVDTEIGPEINPMLDVRRRVP